MISNNNKRMTDQNHRIHYNKIDGKILKSALHLLEFSIKPVPQKDLPFHAIKADISVEELLATHVQTRSGMFIDFLKGFTSVVPLAQNLLILYNLKGKYELDLIETIEAKKESLFISEYSLISITSGHIYSTWLKTIY